MATTSQTRPALATIEFVGPPRGLIALGEIDNLAQADWRLEGNIAQYLAQRGSALRQRRRAGGGLRLRLQAHTPPGDYPAKLYVGEKPVDVMVRVLPAMQVTINPSELSFVGPPGGRATALMTLVNAGNVPVELPATAPVGAFDDDGIETAFAATYGKPVETFDNFVQIFHGKLREAHGGVMKLTITRGAGLHPPGTSAVVEMTLDLPKDLRAGHRYHGVFSTDFASLALSIITVKRNLK
jgi:hypothetical protein